MIQRLKARYIGAERKGAYHRGSFYTLELEKHGFFKHLFQGGYRFKLWKLKTLVSNKYGTTKTRTNPLVYKTMKDLELQWSILEFLENK